MKGIKASMRDLRRGERDVRRPQTRQKARVSYTEDGTPKISRIVEYLHPTKGWKKA